MTPRTTVLKARDIVRVLNSLGFSVLRQKGSHMMFGHPDGRFTLVPNHGGEDIGRGLLRKILREIEVTPDEFMNLL